MFNKFRDLLAKKPWIFNVLRNIIEFNFTKEKELIRKAFGDSAGKTILDIGCGTGTFAPLFVDDIYYGIDLSPDYIQHAKKNKKGTFKIMNATQLEFPDEKFDYALIMAVLHHCDSETVQQILRETRRVLKTQGKALVIEVSHSTEMDNFIFRFLRKFDKGDYIRSPQEYAQLILNNFKIDKEMTFRSGLYVYHSFEVYK
ncbi:MAG: class I SAM-dependent methyltransferase [Patescibacteria group bacterium]